MKKILVEGCGGCPQAMKHIDSRGVLLALCDKTLAALDITWSVNPWYVHPDCPLPDANDEKQANGGVISRQG